MKKTLIVTGAAGGLGEPLCRRLIDDGYRVVAVERNQAKLDSLSGQIGADALATAQVDVLDEQGVEELFATHGENLAGVAHLVGGYGGGDILDTELEALDKLLALNTRSAFLMIRAAARHFAKHPASGSPGIVCVGSVTGRRGGQGHIAYATSKAAVHALVRSAAVDLASRSIRVNAVAPAMIATPANRAAMPDADQSTWVTPAQVGAAIAFLLSDSASAVTGTVVDVAGASWQP